MNLAFPLQFLKPGKALCSAAFPNLSATWNWMASALSNLKGDHDVNQNDGRISVDWTAPDHPVIRCVNCKAKSGGDDSGDDGDDTKEKLAAWDLTVTAESATLSRCLYTMGAVSYYQATASVPATTASIGFICAKISTDGTTSGYSDNAVSGLLCESIGAVRSAQSSNDCVVVPLYCRQSTAEEWIDLRTGVQVQVFDFFNDYGSAS